MQAYYNRSLNKSRDLIENVVHINIQFTYLFTKPKQAFTSKFYFHYEIYAYEKFNVSTFYIAQLLCALDQHDQIVFEALNKTASVRMD